MIREHDAIRLRPALAAGLLGLALIAGPGHAQDATEPTTLDEVQAEFSEAFASIGEFTAEQRDAALAALDETLASLDERIEETEARVRENWSEMSDATQQRTAAALRELREERNQLSESYGALAQGTATAWDDLMAGVRAGWAEVGTAWTEAMTAMTDDGGTADSDS
jgi:septal ring factor EnvC (AmiA/AmiB activator)